MNRKQAMKSADSEPQVVEGDVEKVPNEITVIVREAELGPETAHSLETSFAPLFRQAEKWKAQANGIQVTDASQVHEMKLARASRLGLRAVRIDADKTRKRLKADGLRMGKAIDGVFNVLKYLVEPIEEQLLEQEKFVERQETARKEKLKAEREEALQPFGIDTSFCNLGEMDDDAWANLLTGTQTADKARKEAERKAEEERIAQEKKEAEERERVEKENARLMQEAAEAEKKHAAEREAERLKHEAEMRAQQEEAAKTAAAARKKRLEVEAKAKAEKAKAGKAAEKERQEREKLEAELAAQRAEAEEKERLEAEAAEKERKAKALAASAPDREKMLAMAEHVRAIPRSEAATDEGKRAFKKTFENAERLACWIEENAQSLGEDPE